MIHKFLLFYFQKNNETKKIDYKDKKKYIV